MRREGKRLKMELPEIKNKISQMKISLDRIKSRLDTAGEKTSEIEDIAIKLAKMK